MCSTNVSHWRGLPLAKLPSGCTVPLQCIHHTPAWRLRPGLFNYYTDRACVAAASALYACRCHTRSRAIPSVKHWLQALVRISRLQQHSTRVCTRWQRRAPTASPGRRLAADRRQPHRQNEGHRPRPPAHTHIHIHKQTQTYTRAVYVLLCDHIASRARA